MLFQIKKKSAPIEKSGDAQYTNTGESPFTPSIQFFFQIMQVQKKNLNLDTEQVWKMDQFLEIN